MIQCRLGSLKLQNFSCTAGLFYNQGRSDRESFSNGYLLSLFRHFRIILLAELVLDAPLENVSINMFKTKKNK